MPPSLIPAQVLEPPGTLAILTPPKGLRADRSWVENLSSSLFVYDREFV